MRRTGIALLCSLVVLLIPVITNAATWNVPSAECPTIQAGIDSAVAGDTVLVAAGIYAEDWQMTNNGSTILVMKSGICLRSETGEADCVTIDARQLGRVVYCDSLGSDTRIEGFTMIGGRAAGALPANCGGGVYCEASSIRITDCVFSGNFAEHDGGGMYCRNHSAPRLVNCSFSGNSSERGAGLCCYYYSSATIIDCVFSADSASTYGGGTFIDHQSSASLNNCVFSDNHANLQGGAAKCHSSNPTFSACSFSDNSSDNWGGAVFLENSSPAFNDCSFIGNTSQYGGGIYIYGATPTLTNCTFQGNSALGGGGMMCSSSSSILSHCTFVENSATSRGGGIWCSQTSATLWNTMIAFSSQGEAVYCEGGAPPTLACCNIYGNMGGDWVGCIAAQHGPNGNISEDPLFCGDMNPEQPYTLRSDSPCALENYPQCGQIGAWPVGCEPPMASERVTWSSLKAFYR